MTDDGLKGLIRSGANPRRKIQSLVLTRITDIRAARRLGWGWADVAEALDLGRDRARVLSEAARRVEKAIAAGRLTIPAAIQERPARTPVAAQATTAKGGIPPPPLPGGKAAIKSINDGMDEIRKQFDN